MCSFLSSDHYLQCRGQYRRNRLEYEYTSERKEMCSFKNITQKYNLRIIKAPANPRAALPTATRRLKTDPHHSYSLLLRTNPPSLICSSVAGNLLWSPFSLCCHLQWIPKFSLNLPSAAHPSITSSNTNRRSLWIYRLSRPGKWAAHSHHTLQNSREEIETMEPNTHSAMTSQAIRP